MRRGNNRTLAVTAGGGTVTFGGVVGGAQALADLDVTGGAIRIHTTGIGVNAGAGGATASFAGPVTLGANLTVNASGTNDNHVHFGGTIDADATGNNRTLTVNAGTAAITFAGAIGASQLPASLTATGGTIAVNGGAVSTSDTQHYTGAVTLGAGTTFTGTTGSFAGTIAGGGFDLTLNFSGLTTVNASTFTNVNHFATGNGGTTELSGVITTAGSQTYNDAVTLAGATTLASTGNAGIVFANAVNGAFDLTVNTAGGTTFGAAVGSGTALASLTTNAGGATAINGGAVVTTGAQSYGDAVTLGAAATTVSSTGAGAITFGGTLNGASALTVNTAGATTFGAAVGSGTVLTSLTTDAGGTTAINGGAVITTGAQSYGDAVTLGAGTTFTGTTGSFAGTIAGGGFDLTLNFSGLTTVNASTFTNVNHFATGNGGTTELSGVITTAGSQTYNDAVTLTGATTLASTGNAGIVFANAVNGAFDLTVNTAGGTTFGAAVGSGTALASLTTNAGGTTAINGGAVITTGAQSYGDAVTLGAGTTFTGTTGSFAGTIAGGGFDLTLNFSGLTTVNASTFTNVNHFATGNGGTTELSGVITTAGSQTYNDAVTLAGATTLASTGNAGIVFANAVNGAFDLTVNTAGATTFGAAVGSGTVLASLTTNAGGATAINGGAVVTTGAQSYGDAVTLGADTTLSGVGVSFGSTVNSSGANRALTVNDSGATTFGGVVGGALALASLTTNAGGATAINGGAVVTTGAQSYGDAVTLGAGTTFTGTTGSFAGTIAGGGFDLTLNFSGLTTVNASTFTNVNNFATGNGGTTELSGVITTAGSQTYNDAVTLAGATTLASTGNAGIVFANAVNGAFDLTVNTAGATTFGAAVGSGTVLASLTTNAGGATAINGGAVVTTGAQSYGDAVTLGADTTLSGVGVSFGSTVNSSGANRALTVNDSGATTFGGVVGGALALASLTTNAGGATAINGGAVVTTGAQSYGDAVTLGADTTLSGVGVSFGSTVNSSGANRALTVNDSGATTFGAAVGSGTALASLTTNAGGATAINGGAVVTTGAQSYGDAVTLGAAATTVSSTGAGAITFGGTLNGASALTVNTAGATTFGGVVGGALALASLTTNAGGATAINGGAVVTTGAQSYGDAVTLGADTTLSGVGVSFGSTVNSSGANRALTVNDSGATTFGGVVGGALALASLTTNAGGATAINGGAVVTTGAQSYGDAVTLGADTTLSGVGVSFGSTVNSSGANRALTVNDSGATTFGGVVGGALALASLTTNAGGATAINGGAVVTTGAQSYNDNVTLGAPATTVTSTGAGAITFGGTLNGASALTVNTAGATTFGATVGSGTALTSLITDAGGTTAINGGAVTTSGGQAYHDAVTFGAPTTLTSTGGVLSAHSTLAAGTNPLTLIADEIDLAGGAGSVTGSGSITLMPMTGSLPINTGSAAGGGGALDLSGADLGALADGFSAILIGQSTGSHPIVVGATTLLDPATIRAPGAGGSISIVGPLTGIGNASLTLNAGTGGIAANGAATAAPGTNLVLDTTGAIVDDGVGAHRLTSTGNLSLLAGAGIGTVAVPVRTDTSSLTAVNGAAGALSIENAGPVTLANSFVNHAPGQEVRLTTRNGSIHTAGVAMQSAGGRIALIANETAAGAGGNIVVGAGGIGSAGGEIVLYASDDVTVNGAVNSGGGPIRMIAGSPGQSGGAFGYNTAHATFAAPHPPAPSEPGPDDNGSIVIGAPVNAGTGNVVLVASTTATPSVTVGIVQGPTAGPVAGTDPLLTGPAVAGNGTITANTITAVTLRGTGGPSGGGAAIDLNNADSPLNSAAGIHLFACAVSGCPAVTGPFVTAPFINQIAAPPPALYADGPIFYTDQFGTNISGIGTVNDFVYFSPGPLTTVDGTTLFGRNISIEALNDVNIDLIAPVRNQNISPGGTVRIIASGNIVYRPTTAGATFGQPGETFDRNLQFIASNNIDLQNAIYLGASGSLVISANQDVVFVDPAAPPGVQPKSGTGSVMMRGNHEIRVGGGLTVNGVDLTIAGGELPAVSPNQNGTGQQLNVAGALDLNLSGNVVIQAGQARPASRSAAVVQGANLNIGKPGAPVRNLTIVGGTGIPGGATADAAVMTAGVANVFATEDVILAGGSLGGALLRGSVVNLGSPGARVRHLALSGGMSPTGGTTSSHAADALVTATGNLGIQLSGNLTVAGGTTDIAPGAAGVVTASAVAGLRGASVALDVLGDVLLRGGIATARAGGNTADSSAAIVSATSFSPVIGGDLTVQGGSANATPATGQSANAKATATLESRGVLDLVVKGNLNVLGGSASASTLAGGARAAANATASLNADDRKVIEVTRNFNVTGGSADTAGANTEATALAGTNSGTSGFAATLDITTGGNMVVRGGPEVGEGVASAAILAGGEIKVRVNGPQGLYLAGGLGTNLFHAITPTTLIEVRGNAYPITITGIYRREAGLALGDAFFLSGAAPLTLTDPQLLRTMDCLAISGGTCVLPASGSRGGDPSKHAGVGICK